MRTHLKIKVCGIKSPENRKQLEVLPVDFFGFIFHPQSPRYMGDLPESDFLELLDTGKIKVGVYVNTPPDQIIRLSRKASIRVVQLHGDESPATCEYLRKNGLKIIKTFRINSIFNFRITEPYSGIADYFLFDTKAGVPGGTGKKFSWNILSEYKGIVPFFLSGGIEPSDGEAISSFRHPLLAGIDLNSRFEDFPGMKNSMKLNRFIDELKKIRP